MDKKHQINIYYLFAAIIFFLLFQNLFRNVQTVEPIPYSEFTRLLERETLTAAEFPPMLPQRPRQGAPLQERRLDTHADRTTTGPRDEAAD